MESWNYTSEGKGFVLSEEMVSTTDSLARSRKMFMGMDLKSPFNYESNIPVSGRQTMENQGFMELGFSDMTRKPIPENPIRGFLGEKIGNRRVTSASSSCMITPNAFLGEENSSSVSQDSSLIDLKLGSLADYIDPQNGKSSIVMPNSSPVVSYTSMKRSRTAGSNSQTPLCQVHGCNMDLSSSKDYHKRHKVCDVHSKTPKVTVNGIEQRFCQQCSRFHLLAEFDDGKRSCRKRLAGHNERRRKPQIDNRSGSRMLGTFLPPRTSFIFPDILPNSVLHPESCEMGNWRMQVKVEDKASYSSHLAMSTPDGHLLSKSFLPTYNMEKACSSFRANGIVTAKARNPYENNYCYPHSLAGSDSISCSLFQNTSSRSEDFTVFNTESTMEGLSGVSDSGCALSLLSSQSQNSPNHLLEIPMDHHPLNIHGSHAYFSVSQNSERLLGVTSQVSTSVPSNRFSSSGMNSTELDQLGPILISSASNAVDYEGHTNGIFAGSHFLNEKNHLSLEHGSTANLFQLSSQRQSVEHQRQSMQGKQENDVFCSLPIS